MQLRKITRRIQSLVRGQSIQSGWWFVFSINAQSMRPLHILLVTKTKHSSSFLVLVLSLCFLHLVSLLVSPYVGHSTFKM